MGNWELAGISLNLIGSPVFSIARPQKNTLIDKYLNYKRDKSKLHILRREDRRINLDGLFDDNHAKFNFEDGKKIFFSIDESDWIQESITSIEDCEVQIF